MKKNILVTGASYGSLGHDFCERCWGEFEIINIINHSDDCSNGIFHGIHRCDMSDINEVVDVFSNINSKYEISAYINFTGISYIEWFKDIQIEQFQRAMNVNLNSFIFGLRQIEDNLSKNNGIVISIVSSAANIPMTCSLNYNVSKAGLQMAIRQLARELAPKKEICIIGINPSTIENTNMTNYNSDVICEKRGWLKSDLESAKEKMSPSGKMIEKQQVSKLVYYYLTNYNKNISGSIIQMGVF